MVPLLFAGALALSFLAMGCGKNESESHETKPAPSSTFHPDSLKSVPPEEYPKRQFPNSEDFRKDHYHQAIPQLYGVLKGAGVSDAKIDRGYLRFFQGEKARRVGQNDKKLSPLEVVIAAQEAEEVGLKSQVFQKTFGQFHRDPALLLFYGKALLHSGRYDPAEKIFMKEIKDGTHSYLGVSYLGDLFQLRGEYDTAERAYRTVLRKMPKELMTQLHLGDMLMETKRYGAAEDVYLKLWDQNPNPKLVGRRLARLYKKIGEPSNANQYLPKSSNP